LDSLRNSRSGGAWLPRRVTFTRWRARPILAEATGDRVHDAWLLALLAGVGLEPGDSAAALALARRSAVRFPRSRRAERRIAWTFRVTPPAALLKREGAGGRA